jgi:hypothetical protein
MAGTSFVGQDDLESAFNAALRTDILAFAAPIAILGMSEERLRLSQDQSSPLTNLHTLPTQSATFSDDIRQPPRIVQHVTLDIKVLGPLAPL